MAWNKIFFITIIDIRDDDGERQGRKGKRKSDQNACVVCPSKETKGPIMVGPRTWAFVNIGTPQPHHKWQTKVSIMISSLITVLVCIHGMQNLDDNHQQNKLKFLIERYQDPNNVHTS